MYKLTIFFYLPLPGKEDEFQSGWQKFMGLAEKMPGLRRETVSDVEQLVFGSQGHHVIKIHELYFDSRKALNTALQSAEGQTAGNWLHHFTGKRFTLLIAQHKEALPEEFIA
ncbi:MAG: EthD family reductase [Anaerolineales bacterium]|nr:EthD family reductase [Anaerolineales bacterium]